MKKDWMISSSQLDDIQVRIINSTIDKSLVVAGCAGSGKSVLALLQAQRIQRERGSNYQIIVYTKALSKYMESGRQELGLNNSFTYHWWWKNISKCPDSDYIIVDEIQDFTKAEIQEFINATNKHFFFFGDTAQSLYNDLKKNQQGCGTMKVEEIGYLFGENERPKSFELYNNYRLPLPVAKIAQRIGVDLLPFDESVYKSKETAMPHILRYDSFDQEMKAIHRILSTNSGRMNDVAILLPTNDAVKSAYNSLKNLGGNYEYRYTENQREVTTLNFNSTNPKIMTYHSAKGLQFETVFLPSLDGFSDSNRKTLYVAMTRTYRDLYMMYSGSKPNILSNIPSDLYKTTETDTIEDF